MFRNQNYFVRFRFKLLGKAWEKIIVSIKRTTSLKQSELVTVLTVLLTNLTTIADLILMWTLWVFELCSSAVPVTTPPTGTAPSSEQVLAKLTCGSIIDRQILQFLLWNTGPKHGMLLWYDTYCMNVNPHTSRNISEVCRNVDFQHLIPAILGISGTWWL